MVFGNRDWWIYTLQSTCQSVVDTQLEPLDLPRFDLGREGEKREVDLFFRELACLARSHRVWRMAVHVRSWQFHSPSLRLLARALQGSFKKNFGRLSLFSNLEISKKNQNFWHLLETRRPGNCKPIVPHGSVCQEVRWLPPLDGHLQGCLQVPDCLSLSLPAWHCF